MTSSSVDITPIQGLVQQLWDRGGTDIHLTSGMAPQFRIDGELTPAEGSAPFHPADLRTLAEALLPEDLFARLEAGDEVDFAFSWQETIRFRGNAFLQRGNVAVALRAIPHRIPTTDELLLPPAIVDLARLGQGLVLITGPTGSGKSTTLASLIDVVNRTRQCHIMTIEDPVEFVHRSKKALVNQREVGEDTGAFGTALTQAMRQDPDVILVGEMRDLDTISTAITAAETGHLVFGTLHTQDAAQTVDRIIDVFPAEQQGQVRIQLANSLVGVSTQQLVPTADGRSRAVACEVLIANTAIRALIRDGKVHQILNAMSSGKRLGMQTMDESLADLVRRGVVNADQAMRRAKNTDELARMIGMPPKP